MASKLIDYVTTSDSLKISKLAFAYSVQPDVVANGTALHYDLCPAKPAGKLLLDLDLSKFGFPGLDFHATAIGSDAGEADGMPLIRWDVDQRIGLDVDQFGVTLDRITGGFTTAVAPIDPAVKQRSCEGTDRFYGAVLNTTGSDNGFVVKVHKDVLGISHDGTVTIDQFVMDASAGEPLDLAVSVSVPSDVCTRPIYEGGQAKAFGITKGVPLGVKETYAWRIEGGVPLGPTDQWQVEFTTPTTDPVYVSVDVHAGDRSAFDTAIVVPMPASLGPINALLCELRTLARLNLFVNPLWDPLRDYVTRPVTAVEMRRLETFARHLSKAAGQLLKATQRKSETTRGARQKESS